MKNIFKLLGVISVLFLLMIWATPSTAAVSLDKLKVDLGLQYRVMYNFSNIGTKDDYDFFRQRMRITLDVKPAANVGGFAQIEYRGGWGGTSPACDDPRDCDPDEISPAFNRLQARGIRYGYVYAAPKEGNMLMAGIIPAIDQVGRTLFDADWNFNVGGIVYMGNAEAIDYRVAYLRLLDDLADLEDDQNGHFGVLDINTSLNAVKLGAHIYYLSIDEDLNPTVTIPKITQGWYGVTAATKIGMVDLNGFVLLNDGEFSSGGVDTDNDGVGVKVEGTVPVGNMRISGMGIVTTGDETPAEGFMTPEFLLGMSGYWGYTYIFSAHAPSDVNDFALEIGNRGYGLTTIQAKLDIPIADRLDGQIQVGWFQSSEDVILDTDGDGIPDTNFGDDLGTEFGGQIKYEVAKNLNLVVGAAFASLDDGAALYQGIDPITLDTVVEDSVKEVFARFQLEF